MDANRGVEAEAAADLSGEHVVDGMLVEEAAPLEEAEHTALQRALEALHVLVSKVRRLMERDGGRVALGEHAIEDDDVEVEVGIEGRAPGPQGGGIRAMRRGC